MKDQLLALLQNHWPVMQATIITVLSGVVLNVLNGLLNSPNEKAGKLARLISWVLDMVTIATKKDAPGTFKMPFKTSKKAANGVKAALVFFMLIPFASSGCACWGEKKDTKACIVARQALDCTMAAIKDLAPAAVAFVTGAIASGSPIWDDVLQALRTQGIQDGTCIIASVLNDFVARPAASPQRAALLDSFHKWLPGVKVKLPEGKSL